MNAPQCYVIHTLFVLFLTPSSSSSSSSSLHRNIIDIFSEIHTRHRNTNCGQKVVFFSALNLAAALEVTIINSRLHRGMLRLFSSTGTVLLSSG
jgi:hypothetical protein